MKVTRTEDGVFHLTAETMADAELVDCIDMDGADAITLATRERSPHVGGGYRTTGVSLTVDKRHPRALEAQSARQFLRAVRELLRLGLGEDALHSHIGLDAADPQTQDKIAALFKQLQLVLEIGAVAVGQNKPVRQEVDSTHGKPSGETATVVQQPDAAESSGGTDPLYDQAVELVRKDRKPSIFYVQRKLRCGYVRAAAMLEAMEKAGIVSRADHMGTREVMA